MKMRMAGWWVGERFIRETYALFNVRFITDQGRGGIILDRSMKIGILFCPDNIRLLGTEAHLRNFARSESALASLWLIANRSRSALYHTQVDMINEQMLRQPTAGEPNSLPSWSPAFAEEIELLESRNVSLTRDRVNVRAAFLHEDSIRRLDG